MSQAKNHKKLQIKSRHIIQSLDSNHGSIASRNMKGVLAQMVVEQEEIRRLQHRRVFVRGGIFSSCTDRLWQRQAFDGKIMQVKRGWHNYTNKIIWWKKYTTTIWWQNYTN